MVVVGLQERDYKIKYFDKNDNGVYRIDIKRHEDDFWQSDEYKECERILGDNLIEGTYGSDTYTLWIKADEEQPQELEVNEECSHLPKPTQSLMNDAIKAYPDDKEKRAAYNLPITKKCLPLR